MHFKGWRQLITLVKASNSYLQVRFKCINNKWFLFCLRCRILY